MYRFRVGPLLGLTIFMFIFAATLNVASSVCPLKCKCVKADFSVDCSNASLTAVPAALPKSTRILILSGNEIATLPADVFRPFAKRLEVLQLSNNRLTVIEGVWLRGLRKLTELDVSSNDLERIDLLAFKDLTSLQTLKLRNNNLRTLNDGAFWGLQELKKLNLESNQLGEVRLNWTYGLNALQELNLRHNSVRNISRGSFGPMTQLTKLWLNDNQLTRLEADVFAGLRNLQVLRLGNNRLEFIDETAFLRLDSIQMLDLSHNSISWSFERTRVGIFSQMPALRRLKLNDNRIQLLHPSSFNGTEALRELDLSNNPITTIEPDTFGRLNALQSLSLNGSRLYCDCSMKPLYKWLKSSQQRRRFADTVHCAQPEVMRDKTVRSILDARENDFDCSDRHRPVLIDNFKAFGKQALHAIKHKSISFYCKVAASEPDNVRFQWIKGNAQLGDFEPGGRIESRIHHSPYPDNATLLTNILSLSDVIDADEDQYQCMASNEYGIVYSHPFRVNVYATPQFVKEPTNITVKIGSTVRWNCSAHGQPQPQISWNKSLSKFAAGEERRLRIDGDNFFILNATREDTGTYTCTARNEAGSAVSTVSLKVVQPATFVGSSPDVLTAEIDSPASLKCIAVGLPTPTIQWHRNGTPLERTNRHFFTHQDQFLLIVKMREDDAGKYSCVAENEYGRVEAEFDLKAIPKRAVVDEDVDPYKFLATHVQYICIVVLVILITSMAWVTLFVCYHRKRKLRKATMRDHTNHTSVGANNGVGGGVGAVAPSNRPVMTTTTQLTDAHFDDHQSDSSRDTGIESNLTNEHFPTHFAGMPWNHNRRSVQSQLLHPQYPYHSLSRGGAVYPVTLQQRFATNSLSRSHHRNSQMMRELLPVPQQFTTLPRQMMSHHHHPNSATSPQNILVGGDVHIHENNFQQVNSLKETRQHSPDQQIETDL